MKNFTHTQIQNILKSTWPDLRQIWLFDKNYTAISKEAFELLLMHDVKQIEVAFDRDSFDCDDYSLVMNALVRLAVAKRFHYGIAFGEVVVRNTVIKDVHSLNLLITANGTVEFYEPQDRKFISGENFEPFYVRI